MNDELDRHLNELASRSVPAPNDAFADDLDDRLRLLAAERAMSGRRADSSPWLRPVFGLIAAMSLLVVGVVGSGLLDADSDKVDRARVELLMASDISVQLPDGTIVEGTVGLDLPEGTVITAGSGGAAVMQTDRGDIRLAAGESVIITDGRPRPVSPRPRPHHGCHHHDNQTARPGSACRYSHHHESARSINDDHFPTSGSPDNHVIDDHHHAAGQAAARHRPASVNIAAGVVGSPHLIHDLDYLSA